MRVKCFDLLLVKIGCLKNLLIQISYFHILDNTFYSILLSVDLFYVKLLDLGKRNL